MCTTDPWFALQTKSGKEKAVAHILQDKGFECFVPIYRHKKSWCYKVVRIDLPLFPTYVFCRIDPFGFGKAVSTQGVTRIVGFGGEPARIDTKEVDALRSLAQSSLLREPWEYIPEGTKVQVETGPLAGTHGLLCPNKDKQYLVVSVMMLQRSVAVRLDENTVLSVIDCPKKHGKGQILFSYEAEIAMKLLSRERP